ncbi:MAG: hypothetical protein ACYTBJ_02510 [Planctomycetota bacterium]|jgi:hypothetical protein
MLLKTFIFVLGTATTFGIFAVRGGGSKPRNAYLNYLRVNAGR